MYIANRAQQRQGGRQASKRETRYGDVPGNASQPVVLICISHSLKIREKDSSKEPESGPFTSPSNPGVKRKLMPPRRLYRETYLSIPLRPAYNATRTTQSTVQEDFL